MTSWALSTGAIDHRSRFSLQRILASSLLSMVRWVSFIMILCRGERMTFAVFAHLFSTLLDLLGLLARSEHEKDLEILLLRQQICVLQRTRARPPRLSWWDKLPLTILAAKLMQGAKHSRVRLSQSLLLFAPETVLRWHRELVRHKWTFPHRLAVGRPRIPPDLEVLILRLARENPAGGTAKSKENCSSLATILGAPLFELSSSASISLERPCVPDTAAPGGLSCASINSNSSLVISSR